MAADFRMSNYKLGVNNVVVVDGDAKLVSDGTPIRVVRRQQKSVKKSSGIYRMFPGGYRPIAYGEPAKGNRCLRLDRFYRTQWNADLVFLNWDYEIVRTMDLKGKVCHEKKATCQNMVNI